MATELRVHVRARVCVRGCVFTCVRVCVCACVRARACLQGEVGQGVGSTLQGGVRLGGKGVY